VDETEVKINTGVTYRGRRKRGRKSYALCHTLPSTKSVRSEIPE
jgi:hypothetical protein